MTGTQRHVGTPRGTLRDSPRVYLWLATAVVAVLMVTPREAAATVILPADFSEMVSGSQVIVHGSVIQVESRMNGDGRSIESFVTVVVTQSLKGDPGPVVVFRVPNGQVGRYRRVTVGAPEFRQGDEVVLFLKGRPPGVPMPFGLNQGVYRVQRLPGGRTLVSPAPVLAKAGGERIVRGDPARRPLALDAFVREVRSVTFSRSAPVRVPDSGRRAVPRTPQAGTDSRVAQERQP